MPNVADILALPAGARFHRADLHVHSFGGSHDVSDRTMTPANLASMAVSENLQLLAVTDHNEIVNVQATIDAAPSALFVVPGVELSTSQGHLLCYFPSADALSRFYGRLSIVDRGSANSRCQQSMLDCLDLVDGQEGFAILAHVDVASGLEQQMPGMSPHKVDILCHRALLGIELKQATSDISYGPHDPNPDRCKTGKERTSRLRLGTSQQLARVLNSDAHSLRALGRNAQEDKRVTRYKMDAPSFMGLRIALEDADARVRIEDLIPQSIPQILGVSFEGGFLGETSIHFGANLNCIVGGRGTGKSTAFEGVRCLSDSPSESKVIDSDAWPDELHLFWQDQAGEIQELRRLKDGELENLRGPLAPDSFRIDCFSQGEAAKIGQDAQSDPLALLRYLDRFVHLEAAEEAEQAARDRLLELQTEIEKAEQRVAQIPQYEQVLATTQRQLTALKKPEVKELIELQQEIASERTLRTSIASTMADIVDALSFEEVLETTQSIQLLASPRELALGGAEFQAILKAFDVFKTAVLQAKTKAGEELERLRQVVQTHTEVWKTKDAEAQKKIDEKRRELEALKVQFDMAYISKLAKDEAEYLTTVRNLKTWVPHLADLKTQRATALAERWKARTRVAQLRDAFGRLATTKLREALRDLNVSLKYQANALSPEGTDQIIEAMGWRTNQQPRSQWLVRDLTIPKLLKAVEKKDWHPVADLKTPEGASVFSKADAQDLISRLSEPAVLFALQRVAIFDLPLLRVTKLVPDGKGGARPLTKDFAKLSLGQQQSVLLALILSTEGSDPLIIDQPEDNLDGEFIYWTLVPVLRQAKERRQVVIVTHNANVAVLGDAEQIVVMKAVNDRGEVVARASIDDKTTRDAACAILEGAAEAFIRRAKVYGLATTPR